MLAAHLHKRPKPLRPACVRPACDGAPADLEVVLLRRLPKSPAERNQNVFYHVSTRFAKGHPPGPKVTA